MDRAHKINHLFQQMKIAARLIKMSKGLRTVRYFTEVSPSQKVSQIKALSDEIALAIKSPPPDIYIDPTCGYLIIEVSLTEDNVSVKLDQILTQHLINQYQLPLVLGKKMDGETFSFDLEKAPHILVGGATGSGKSILTKTMINSLLSKYNSQKDLQLALVDPKKTELVEYQSLQTTGIYCSDVDEASAMLDDTILIMEDRYSLMQANRVSDFTEYRKIARSKHPYLVIIIDELADILIQDEEKSKVKNSLIRLLQKSRAAGIHIIANTQRPSSKLISGDIKANLPIQIALKTSSKIDSRIIIGEDGAEKLVGRGDMIINLQGEKTRVQGAS